MDRIQELRRDRVKAVADARKVIDKAIAEKRGLTAEETQESERAFAEADRLEKEIKSLEDVRTADARAKAAEDELRASAGRITEPPAPKDETTEAKRAADALRSFNAVLRGGRNAVPDAEYRALAASSDVTGGALQPPIVWVNELLQAVDNAVFIRGLARKYTLTNAQSMGMPSLDADPAAPTWTSEIATGTEDSSMAFGKREMSPHPLAKLIKISNKLLRLSPEVAGLVKERLAYVFGITLEQVYLTGHGSNQPLGLFTAASQGISTGRDTVVGTSTAITMDGLIDCQMALKGQYQGKAKWLHSRAGVKAIRKLKSTDLGYIWQPSTQVGQPDSLLGKPVLMSEYVPATFTSGLYVGMYADFSYYAVCDALTLTVQRLDELYAATNQTGFIGRFETDGLPLLEEAFVRCTLA